MDSDRGVRFRIEIGPSTKRFNGDRVFAGSAITPVPQIYEQRPQDRGRPKYLVLDDLRERSFQIRRLGSIHSAVGRLNLLL